MEPATIDWSKTDWKNIREGVDQKAFSGAGATLALHRLQPGHEPNPHAHVYEQIVYILQGQVDFHVGGEIVRLGPGGLMVIPPDVTHHAVVVGDEEVLNLDVFTPRRPDFA